MSNCTQRDHAIFVSKLAGMFILFLITQGYATSALAASHLVTTTTTTYVYDSYGNPTDITVTVTDGTETFVTESDNTYSNDTTNWFLGRLTRAEVTQTNPDLTSGTRVSSFTYSTTTGLLSQEKIEPDISALTLTTDYVYDAFGNKTSVTVSGIDITTRTTNSSYDIRGQFATTITNALGHSETRTYDAKYGVMLSLTGPNNLTTTWTYDSFGRQLTETRADGTTTTITREWCNGFNGEVGNLNCPTGGALSLTTQTTGAPMSVAYSDALGRVILNETEGFAASGGTPNAIYVDTDYNALGQISRKSRPYFSGDTQYWSTFTYDVLGRVLTATAPDLSVTSSTYNGLSTSVINALSQTNTRTKNARGELAQVVDSQNNVTDYKYDPFGNLIEVEDALLNVISNSYDIRGRKINMNDPDMGSWSYQYNALGELVSQTDALSQTVSMTYDLLGRLVTRTELEGLTTWIYDTASYGIGKLATLTSVEGKDETYSYDSLGRLASTTVTIDSINYTTSQTYDLNGRSDTITYPASTQYPLGLEVQNIYNVEGYLEKVQNVSSALTYWQANTMNAEGQLTRFNLGNGTTTNRAYTAATGLLNAIGTGTALNVNGVQDLTFTFDTIGNITQRQDIAQGVSESFVYDVLNRMTSTTLDDGTTQTSKTYSYDALGNITFKSDIGSYSYGSGAGPHAVTSAGGQSLIYDANGNMTAGWNFTASQSRTISYTSYNKPNQVIQGSSTLSFSYGADLGRFKQDNSNGKTTIYLGSLYEKETESGLTTHIHYIKAGGSTVAMVKSMSNSTEETRYLHRDHLGSLMAITDETAQVVEELSYDPHGKRRQASWEDAITQIFAQETHHSFTNHEYLDDVGLIHMNGRIYDPDLGRFLSPDPFIQFPEVGQSYNRYSYVLNNPLSFTDPSGFGLLSFIWDAITAPFDALIDLGEAIVGFVNDAINFITGGNQFLKFALGAIAAWYTAGLASGAYYGSVVPAGSIIGTQSGIALSTHIAATTTGSIIGGAVGGFVAGAIISGDLKTALLAGLTGAALGGVNAYFGDTWNLQRVFADGAVRGTSSELQGGKFKDGFTIAVTTSLVKVGVEKFKEAYPDPTSIKPISPVSLGLKPKKADYLVGIDGSENYIVGSRADGSGVLGFIEKNVFGLHSAAAFHDPWVVFVKPWAGNNLLTNQSTILPVFAVNYYAAGVGNLTYQNSLYEENKEENNMGQK